MEQNTETTDNGKIKLWNNKWYSVKKLNLKTKTRRNTLRQNNDNVDDGETK